MTSAPLDTARLVDLLWKGGDDATPEQHDAALTPDEAVELDYLLQRLDGAEVH